MNRLRRCCLTRHVSPTFPLSRAPLPAWLTPCRVPSHPPAAAATPLPTCNGHSALSAPSTDPLGRYAPPFPISPDFTPRNRSYLKRFYPTCIHSTILKQHFQFKACGSPALHFCALALLQRIYSSSRHACLKNDLNSILCLSNCFIFGLLNRLN